MAPFTDPERDQVSELHAAGMGRNAISKETGIHQRRVSAIAESLGLTFVRSPHTAAAAEAKKIDGKARRAALALRLLEDAERLRQSLFTPCTAYNFGGKDNTFEQVRLSEPSFRDKQSIMAAIGLAVDRSVKLDLYDRADESLNGVDAWLAVMAGSK